MWNILTKFKINAVCCCTHDICISNNVEYFGKEESNRAASILPKRFIVILSLCNAIKKRLGEISCHKHYNFLAPVSINISEVDSHLLPGSA